MRVVSLVPSWTETLVECGVNVVGRTRYCIHPRGALENVAVVGGTKAVKWNRIASLEPDLILMDREENPLSLALESPIPWWSTHVRSLKDLPRELEGMAGRLDNGGLRELSYRWERLSSVSPKSQETHKLMEFPGVLSWIREPERMPETVLYIIWKNPWMAVSQGTFIGSVLGHLGWAQKLPVFDKRYPEIDLSTFSSSSTLLLFSSEPYPFGKEVEELKQLPFASALVDGECFSWFGVRTLRFLEGL